MSLIKSIRCGIFIYIVLSGWQCQSKLPVPNYHTQAAKMISALDSWYHTDKPDMGVWQTTSWWNSANILTALVRYAEITKEEHVFHQIAEIYEVTDSFEVPAYEDRAAWICQHYCNAWYDDEGWWINAWLEAYAITENPEYLNVAIYIFADLTNGWTEACDGGILWKKGYTNKASISNSLSLMAAARLAIIYRESPNGAFYGEWANRIWQWIGSKNIITNNLVIDGVNAENCQTNDHIWTYNQGSMIGALVAYSELKRDSAFLDIAHSLAKQGIEYFSNEFGILTESCEPSDCTGDNCQFKGIFMRNLATLELADPQPEYRKFILLNANSIWDVARDPETYLVGISWSQKNETATACTQGSALDAMVAAMMVE